MSAVSLYEYSECVYECSDCVYECSECVYMSAVRVCKHMACLGSHEPLHVECNQFLSKTMNPNFPSPTPSFPPYHILTSSPPTSHTSHYPHLQPTFSLSLHKIGSAIVIMHDAQGL